MDTLPGSPLAWHINQVLCCHFSAQGTCEQRGPVQAALTCGHEEGNAELAAEHPGPQVLQRAAVEGQSTTHQHVQHHAEALHPGCGSSSRERPEHNGQSWGMVCRDNK